MIRIVIAALFMAAAASAQRASDFSSVVVAVSGPAGQGLENAAITAQRDSASQEFTARSSKAGYATVGPLPPGTYRFSAEMVGFTRYTTTVTIAAGARDTLCLPLGRPSGPIFVTCSTRGPCGPSPVYPDTARRRMEGVSCR